MVLFFCFPVLPFPCQGLLGPAPGLGPHLISLISTSTPTTALKTPQLPSSRDHQVTNIEVRWGLWACALIMQPLLSDGGTCFGPMGLRFSPMGLTKTDEYGAILVSKRAQVLLGGCVNCSAVACNQCCRRRRDRRSRTRTMTIFEY